MVKQKLHLLLKNGDQLSNLDMDFVPVLLPLIDICSNLIVLLKPEFNCCIIFA